MPEDRNISQLLHRDEREGFDALFRSYYPISVRVAYYLTTHREIAEKITLDTFVKLWKNREKLKVVSKLKTYVLTSIKNASLEYLEHEKPEPRKLHLKWVKNNTDQQEKEIKAQLELIMQKIPNQSRLVFSLNRFEGYSNQEISESLGISVRMVETYLSKALKIIRKTLKQMINEGSSQPSPDINSI